MAYPLRGVLISLGPHWHSIFDSRRGADMLKWVLFVCVTKLEVVVLCGVRLVKDWRFGAWFGIEKARGLIVLSASSLGLRRDYRLHILLLRGCGFPWRGLIIFVTGGE
jgi:hypothetical protein